ncbi:MAG: polymorphic toxin type 44 domain-containing protein [Candidatus Acidiferrales bacterium]
MRHPPDFGNFNYGAVCGNVGFSLTYCQSAAGLGLMGRTSYKDAEYYLGLGRHYQYNGAGIPFLEAPFGDQPGDAAQIALGYAYQLCLNGG